MNLVPHPDYLVLADDCQEYHHTFKVDTFNVSNSFQQISEEEQKEVHVINPGNFGAERKFVVLYPVTGDV